MKKLLLFIFLTTSVFASALEIVSAVSVNGINGLYLQKNYPILFKVRDNCFIEAEVYFDSRFSAQIRLIQSICDNVNKEIRGFVFEDSQQGLMLGLPLQITAINTVDLSNELKYSLPSNQKVKIYILP